MRLTETTILKPHRQNCPGKDHNSAEFGFYYTLYKWRYLFWPFTCSYRQWTLDLLLEEGKFVWRDLLQEFHVIIEISNSNTSKFLISPNFNQSVLKHLRNLERNNIRRIQELPPVEILSIPLNKQGLYAICYYAGGSSHCHMLDHALSKSQL